MNNPNKRPNKGAAHNARGRWCSIVNRSLTAPVTAAASCRLKVTHGATSFASSKAAPAARGASVNPSFEFAAAPSRV
jgi:hypothetical protein